MTASDTFDRLPDAVTEVFGADATAAHAYDLLTVDVPAAGWTAALETARDELGCTYFDWLSAVDEPGTGFRVCAHVATLGEGTVRRLLLRTTVPHDAATLPTAIGVYAGAAWHERETHEMFGIVFEDHPHLVPLLLPEAFEGHPLRKDFVLAARVAKAWPGAKEPGESEHGGPKRRTMLPPGVPDPNEWGPLKGQLPPAPARPARGARAAGERPVRRARSASEGSAAQRPDAAETPQTETPQAARPRRSRSVSQGSASQAGGPAPTPPAATTDPGAAREAGTAGSADAPWHDARPAFDEAPKQPTGEQRSVPPEPASAPAPEPASAPAPAPAPEPAPEPEPEPATASEPALEPKGPSEPEPSEPEPAAEPERAPGPEGPSEPEESESSAQGEAADGDPDQASDSDQGHASESDRGHASDSDPGSGPDSAPEPAPEPAPDSSSRSDRSAGPDRPAGGDTA
ncbi:NADH-quinone oxidoreductase subunit C [Streptomyces sp. NPDC049944]|uniref:NADH-quinone oxidoreductase subunit C n=1 Tax=Streptomyces sp. NPDC049944 TaxID=3155657 RepID=UPI00341B2A4A